MWIYAYLLCFDTKATQCWIRGKNCKSDKRSRGSDGNFGTFTAVIVLSCYCMIHLLYMSVCIFIHYCWRGIFKFGWFQTIFIFLYFQIMEKYGINSKMNFSSKWFQTCLSWFLRLTYSNVLLEKRQLHYFLSALKLFWAGIILSCNTYVKQRRAQNWFNCVWSILTLDPFWPMGYL